MANNMNPITAIQKWMDTMAGQTFMNYAYSWGAAIVILGTLFKLTHIPGANLMLFVGMGAEVFVFFISGFERVTEEKPEEAAAAPAPVAQPAVAQPVIVEASVAPASVLQPVEPEAAVAQPAAPVQPVVVQPASEAASVVAASLAAAGQAAAQAQLALSQLQGASLTDPALLRATDPSKVEEAVKGYAEELTALTEVLGRVKAQAARMSTDSEEMENLNRTLTGIATVYELQLRNISKQVATIEQIDEQTRRMAQQIEELNNVYGRMIQALTVNMAPAAPTANPA